MESNAVYPHVYFKNALDKNTCENIINLGKDKWFPAEVGNGKIDPNKRITDIAGSNETWLYDICWQYLHVANREAHWNFEISSCEEMQITKYNKNGHYDFHQDGNGFTQFNMPHNEFLHGKTRKLSMTIVLNEEYEGGEFEFFDDENLIKEKQGTIIVFPSYMVHKVRPITEGVRYSLVAWFCGSPFK